MKIMPILVAGMTLTSCTTARLYPVCFYNTSPPTGAAGELFYSKLSKALTVSLSAERDVKAVPTPDGRWFVASVTPTENAVAAGVWPRIGCVGEARDSDEVRAEASCVEYMQRFVADQNYFAFGDSKDAGGIDIWNESLNPKNVVHCSAILPNS
jgi:hypothetical protein